MTELIHGDKVYLRPMLIFKGEGKIDTQHIVEWRNNPRVRKNFIFRETFTCAMHEEWIKNKVLTGEVIQYIICEKNSNRAIGSVYFRDINPVYKSAEFGIFIGEDNSIGKGYGTEATQLFTTFGLQVLDFHRIFLRVLKSNERACHSYYSSGYIKEGEFRDMVFLDGRYENVIFMAILKEQSVFV